MIFLIPVAVSSRLPFCRILATAPLCFRRAAGGDKEICQCHDVFLNSLHKFVRSTSLSLSSKGVSSPEEIADRMNLPATMSNTRQRLAPS